MAAPAPYMPKFQFKRGSKFNNNSEVQQEVLAALEAQRSKNGFALLPCGGGKTSVILASGMRAGHKVLIFCYESQGVHQMAQALRENTTLLPTQICVYSGKARDRDVPNSRFCFLVTTYGMFASKEAHRSKHSEKVRKYVYDTKWDLVCCDEAHHMCATTYRPMIESLKATRKLGFTATLFRNEYCSLTQGRLAHERENFGWFGEVLCRESCRGLEEKGLIAKIRRATVTVDLTPEFRKAHDMAFGSQKKYIASLNPAKLNALKSVCEIHKRMGHAGIVFVTHLLAAKVVKDCLGEGWEVLSGGSAHGEEDAHTSELNAKIVQRFNDGKLVGMVCTAVGYSSMDVPLPRFCYVAVIDADGGVASAAQRLGRVARNERVTRLEGESDIDLHARRRSQQKEATYYDFITRDTEDEMAATRRKVLFEIEGYGDEIVIAPEVVLSNAKEHGVPLAFESLVEQVALLAEVLQYRTLGSVCAAANAVAVMAKAPQSGKVKAHRENAKMAQSSIAKKLHLRKAGQAKQREKVVAQEAKEERRKTIDSAPMSEESLKILRALQLPIPVLDAAGLIDLCYPPSDDDL